MLHVNNLPLGSAFVAETRGGYQFIGWDQDRYMFAGLIDSIKVLQHILILCNVDPKKKKPDPPEPYPLPDHLEREKVEEPGSFGLMLIKAKQAKAARQEAGDGWPSSANLPTAPSPADEVNKSSAIPTTGKNFEANRSGPSGRCGAPQRWKRNSR